MPPSERDLAHLWDMRQAASDAVAFMRGKDRQTWADDRMLRLAVERCLEILGEAARRVSKSTQVEHVEVPWREIIGMRNVLAHEYGEVDHQRLFDTVEEDLPRLLEVIAAVLSEDTGP